MQVFSTEYCTNILSARLKIESKDSMEIFDQFTAVFSQSFTSLFYISILNSQFFIPWLLVQGLRIFFFENILYFVISDWF